MSESFDLPSPAPLLVVISGPSGVGKDSVLQRMQERNTPYHFVVTATTRPARANEVHGKDYFFFDTDEFAEMIEQDELLEYAIVYGDYKGIPKQQVRDALASGKDVLLRLDVQGAATIKELCPDALLIFLTTDSEAELERRLHERKSETPEGLKLRIATARKEMQRLSEFDYWVVNSEGSLDQAVDKIIAIIEAEHQRVAHRAVTL
ncbi:MAG: guanylate kinase [Anaerolineales bacterium]